jgi:hypothetical protein
MHYDCGLHSLLVRKVLTSTGVQLDMVKNQKEDRKMRLERTIYGYAAAFDTRLQFHYQVACYYPDCRRGEGWEVRLNGRRGKHYFSTLREAKAWARPYWRPWFFLNLGPQDRTNRCLLQAAIQGDWTALHAWFDREEEQERYRLREWYLHMADEAGLFQA